MGDNTVLARKSSLAVAVRVSKTRVLKLPITTSIHTLIG